LLRAPAEGASLDVLLNDTLPRELGHPVSRSAIRRLVMAGAVLVDGRPCRRPGLALPGGAKVEARVDEARMAPAPPPRTPVILFEDAWLLAVDKPAGLPTHATADPRRPDLASELARFLEQRDGPRPTLHLHQRLDVGTSGVILFSRSAAADQGLARAFAEHQVEKVYLALTVRPRQLPPAEFKVDVSLGRGEGPGQRGGRPLAGPGGQPALTLVSVREVLPRALLVEARPRTGRRHQVRAHLAFAGLPILGDALYAPPSAARQATRPLLHAARLRLAHPVTGAALSIESPLPGDILAAAAAAAKRPGASRSWRSPR
jgi:23S rRNA pseudouridine1911/1915/1917 synthase